MHGPRLSCATSQYHLNHDAIYCKLSKSSALKGWGERAGNATEQTRPLGSLMPT